MAWLVSILVIRYSIQYCEMSIVPHLRLDRLSARLPLMPGISPKIGRLLAIIIAITVYLSLRIMPLLVGLSAGGQTVLAIAGAGTVLWMTEALPVGVTGLAILALLACEPAIGARSAFSGFASEVTIFLIGIVGISAGVETSGLAERGARSLLALSRGDPRRLYWQMIVAFPLMAFVLPSAITRNAILVPAYENVLKSSEIDPSGRLKRAIMLSLGMLNPLASSALLTGGIVSIAAASLLGGFSWLRWFCLMAPPYYALMLAGAGVVRLMVGAFPPGQCIQSPSSAGKPLTPNEIRTLAVLAGTCALWFTDSIHHWSPAVPALLGAIALQLPGIGVVTWKQLETRLSWNLIITVAASMSLALAMTKTGAAAWLGRSFIDQIPMLASHPILFVVGLMTASTIIHLGITNLAACISLLLPITVTVAQTAGLAPMVCGLIVTLNINAVVLYPAQTAVNMFAYDRGYFSAADVRRLGVAMFFLTLVVALCAIPYWKILGLPLTNW